MSDAQDDFRNNAFEAVEMKFNPVADREPATGPCPFCGAAVKPARVDVRVVLINSRLQQGPKKVSVAGDVCEGCGAKHWDAQTLGNAVLAAQVEEMTTAVLVSAEVTCSAASAILARRCLNQICLVALSFVLFAASEGLSAWHPGGWIVAASTIGLNAGGAIAFLSAINVVPKPIRVSDTTAWWARRGNRKRGAEESSQS